MPAFSSLWGEMMGSKNKNIRTEFELRVKEKNEIIDKKRDTDLDRLVRNVKKKWR